MLKVTVWNENRHEQKNPIVTRYLSKRNPWSHRPDFFNLEASKQKRLH